MVLEASEYSAREIHKHSYRIIYGHRRDACYVIRCIHSSRDLAQQLDVTNWPKFPVVTDEDEYPAHIAPDDLIDRPYPLWKFASIVSVATLLLSSLDTFQ